MNWVGKLFLGLGVAAAFLLLFAAVLALTVYDNAKPYIEREYPTPLYERNDTCDLPCTANEAREVWTVPSGANRIVFTAEAQLETPSGAARIVVTDPSGDVLFDRTFTASASESATWTAEAGEWAITRTYAGMRGVLELEAWSHGIPPGSL